MKLQDELLNQITKKYHLTDRTIEAFKRCPRHLFVKKNYSMEEIYSDYPLEIYRDDEYLSTISQPSFVLKMIEMLKLNDQDKVLEIGTGSGWNAALMSCLANFVVSIEIIPRLAQETKNNLEYLGFKNVLIIEGDGASGYEKLSPYNKVIFTAGASDLPMAIYRQIKTDGLLLFVLKTVGADFLLLLKKVEDYFLEIDRVRCAFVPLKGAKGFIPDVELTKLMKNEGKVKIGLAPSNSLRDSIFTII